MFAVLYSYCEDTDVLMICDSESDAYEMVLSFAEEQIYEDWYIEYFWKGMPISEALNLEDVIYNYFVVKVPYCPIFMEME